MGRCRLRPAGPEGPGRRAQVQWTELLLPDSPLPLSFTSVVSPLSEDIALDWFTDRWATRSDA